MRGLKGIAITDHDVVDGISPAIESAPESIEVIPGIEIFAVDNEREIHVLGYFIDHKDPKLSTILNDISRFRENQLQLMMDKINGISDKKINRNMLLKHSPHGFIGKLHIGLAMVDAGIIGNKFDAFTKEYIAEGGACALPITDRTVRDAADIIKEFGGIPIFAHPGYSGALIFSEHDFIRYADDGIMGIECHHMRHTLSISEQCEKIADRLNLLKTGGSDCHGEYYNPVKMGSVEVPDEWLLRLKSARS